MKVVKEYPPNIAKIVAVFPIRKNTVFTYGDSIYAPGVDFELPADLIAHEATHTRQQGDDPETWWDRYIESKEFRFQQELEAYRNQYKSYCSMTKDRNRRFQFLVTISKDLSSPMYGNIVGFLQATQLIKN